MKHASEIQKRLQGLLHEIFVAQGGGVAAEAFGEADFLLNMSSRVNAREDLTPDQVSRIEAIWERENPQKG
jgi:hypothetical protein